MPEFNTSEKVPYEVLMKTFCQLREEEVRDLADYLEIKDTVTRGALLAQKCSQTLKIPTWKELEFILNTFLRRSDLYNLALHGNSPTHNDPSPHVTHRKGPKIPYDIDGLKKIVYSAKNKYYQDENFIRDILRNYDAGIKSFPLVKNVLEAVYVSSIPTIDHAVYEYPFISSSVLLGLSNLSDKIPELDLPEVNEFNIRNAYRDITNKLTLEQWTGYLDIKTLFNENVGNKIRVELEKGQRSSVRSLHPSVMKNWAEENKQKFINILCVEGIDLKFYYSEDRAVQDWMNFRDGSTQFMKDTASESLTLMNRFYDKLKLGQGEKLAIMKAFKDNEIDEELLFDMNQQDLYELLPEFTVGKKMKVRKAIEAVKSEQETTL